MIGGTDYIIKTKAGVQSLDVVLRVVRRRWPDLIVENAITGHQFKNYGELPFAALNEILVYRDSASALQWQEYGAADFLRDTMIHAIADHDALTIVVDAQPSRFIQELVETIQNAVQKDIFNVNVNVRKAA